MPAVKDSKNNYFNAKKCHSNSNISLELPINFKDGNFIDSKSEQNALFEVSTVCTTDSDITAESASLTDETEWESMSLDSDSDQEI